MVHPLAMMAVLAVVFSNIMRIPVQDYAVFLFCGLLPWNYFSSTAMMSLGTIRANTRLFSQIPVPKYVFVLSISFSNLFNFLVSVVPLLLLMLSNASPHSCYGLVFSDYTDSSFLCGDGISLMLAAASVFLKTPNT